MSNSASAVTAQAPGTPGVGGDNPLVVKCEDAPAGSPDKMSDCEKKQICAKCNDVNQQAKAGKLRRPARSQAQKKTARRRGNAAATTFKRRQGNRLSGIGPRGRHQAPVSPESLAGKFAHECAHQEWKDAGADPEMPGLSADHIHEIQLGGSPTSSRNLRMMSSKANEWIGRTLQDYDPDTHTGVAPDCCD